MTPETCPNCGAEIPENAPSCPECGSCEETGWSERAQADALGLPDDTFNYDEFVQREWGNSKRKPKRPRLALVWWITALILTAIVLSWAFCSAASSSVHDP